MFTCAALVLTAVWSSFFGMFPSFLEPLIPTTFVIGLASALYWIAAHLRLLAKKFLI